MTHPILQNEAANESERQIRESIEALDGLTGRTVRFFAYPNGAAGLDYGPREQATLAACGISLAFATDVGFFGPATDPLAIPRASLEPGERAAKIVSKLLLVPIWDKVRSGVERRERLVLRDRIRP
jgi:peptidoglycan/xylan/chitin deacetylase (PgdA/CDA1 family)